VAFEPPGACATCHGPPERWEYKQLEVQAAPAKKRNPFAVILSPRYLGRTIILSHRPGWSRQDLRYGHDRSGLRLGILSAD
jgi:hypothetical protein